MRVLLVLFAFAVLLAACGDPEGGGDGTADNGTSTTEPSPGDPGPITFTTIAQGAHGPAEAGEIVARTAEELQEAWAAHGGEGPAPTEGIDFGPEMAIAVLQGQQPTAGHSVMVAEVSSGYQVRYTRTRPGPDCITAQVLTAPFHVVSVPATDGQVTFVADDQVAEC